MNVAVYEIDLNGTDPDKVRRWALANTRRGDGVFYERSRLFLVLPGVSESEVDAVPRRLSIGAIRLGAKLIPRRREEDPMAESICRRVEARILPIEPRQLV